MSNYEPQEFWGNRLAKSFNLKGVGNIDFSEAYNRWLYQRKRQVMSQIFAWQDLHGANILDIGCGTGFFVDWYMRRGARVTGVDIAEVSIDGLSRQFPKASFELMDIGASDYAPSKLYDIANMWEVCFHIVDDARFARALANIRHSLKQPGGLFICTDYYGAPQSHMVADHVHARNLADHRAVLAPLGFKLKEVRPLFHYLNLPHYWRIDDHAGMLYFLLDQFQRRPAADNVSVAVWELAP